MDLVLRTLLRPCDDLKGHDGTHMFVVGVAEKYVLVCEHKGGRSTSQIIRASIKEALQCRQKWLIEEEGWEPMEEK